MTAAEAIEYIESCTWSETRLGLERTRELLRALGDPQDKLKFVHVAGTNGKGSTCAMTEAILREAGYKTGLYISPYICCFNERIQVRGEYISDDALARITEKVKPIADAMGDHPSQFELVTAIAMEYFHEQGCDIVVLEVGLGGELDSTNVIACPEAAVICTIGLEHTEYLGNTLEEIARAKAGIIKPGCELVCYRNAPEVEAVFEAVCDENHAVLHRADFDSLIPIAHGLDGQRFSWRGMTELYLPLLGEHQLRNAAVVLETISVLKSHGWRISENSIRDGLARVKWPVRFEVLSRDPVVIVDGAHNPQCVDALAKNLSEYLPGEKCTFLVGVLADKDYRAMIDSIRPYAGRFVCVTPNSPRALSAAELAEYLVSLGESATVCESIFEGVASALEAAHGEPAVAFGSLYMAGAAREGFHSALRKLQRKTGIRARDSLTPMQREVRSRAIGDRILESPEFANAKTIMSYRAVKGEVSLEYFNAEAVRRGKRVVYPLCVSKTEMIALLPNSDDAWVPGHFGIMEPSREQSDEVEPANIDLVLCPCSAFDAARNRVGMGGGFYDRYLPKCVNAHVAAVAFEAQKLTHALTDPWDVRMEMVYTEKGCY